ncbi:hypothetical protein AG1IA_06313 [Rhizoctonia solani AG-1 IA]|uniref:Uncharacterized protein n=1 Tax=Thanatephorus cucumeris (strain AG1-IA) TaxID=983506 RepID=L8WS92_THACA|nr:hypothetical protein AG1IA_06313 [Rhizoctonia solani AG-1 IA]
MNPIAWKLEQAQWPIIQQDLLLGLLKSCVFVFLSRELINEILCRTTLILPSPRLTLSSSLAWTIGNPLTTNNEGFTHWSEPSGKPILADGPLKAVNDTGDQKDISIGSLDVHTSSFLPIICWPRVK